MSTSIYNGRCIVVFGAGSLQQYIFQSNRLRENVGASYLAKHCLKESLIEAAHQVDYPVYTNAWDAYQKVDWDKHDTDDFSMPQPDVEDPRSWRKSIDLIYMGGGNAALLCKNRDVADEVVKAWSFRLLEEAPGLRVVVGYGEVECSLAKAYGEALEDLSRCEEALPFGAPLGSLPVVRTCTSTGLPAGIYIKKNTEDDEETAWISQTANCKRNAAQNAITDELKSVLKDKQHFAIQLDRLGGSEGQSYIAVVHADGNGMGKRLNAVIDAPQNDDEFLHNLRAFSASLSHQSLRALLATLRCLQDALPRLKNDLAVNTSRIFPIRPIVYGGDDLTFVCDGRLGLNLAAVYLEEFAKGKISVLGEWEPISACAGIAIVPTKFPFARAYDFADSLCKEAKKRRREQNDENRMETGCWLDFQIIQDGATLSITALRDTQYRSLEGATLHIRPYQVTREESNAVAILEDFQWEAFVDILKVFRSTSWPRNRAKGLLQALTQGSDATARFIEGVRWRDVEPPLSSVSDTGWTGGDRADRTTPYFDPLEALDFYLEVKS